MSEPEKEKTMQEQKLTHAEIVRKSYNLASQFLAASASIANIATFDEQLSDEDVKRVQRQIKKVAERLSRQAH